jgi:ABC-type Fe3+-hydroxamate transport system substrate-binding protein
VGALAGCQESGFDESRETQRPLKVQHAMDELTGTKVPGVAERPLTLTADALGDALALGVTPVGAVDVPPYMREQARGVETLPRDDLAAFEGTAPDVILGSVELYSEEDYDTLRQIAPTVMTEGDNWKLNLRLHGEALGRTNDAERLLVGWDNSVAKVRDQVRQAGVSLVLPAGASPFAEQILADLAAGADAEGGERIRLRSGPEWDGGGILAARAALQDVSAALSAL